jgi:hypothetical protein
MLEMRIYVRKSGIYRPALLPHGTVRSGRSDHKARHLSTYKEGRGSSRAPLRKSCSGRVLSVQSLHGAVSF